MWTVIHDSVAFSFGLASQGNVVLVFVDIIKNIIIYSIYFDSFIARDIQFVNVSGIM